MYSEDQLTLNLYSTFIASTATTNASATVDLGPYFNVNRREVAMLYWYGTASTSSETIYFCLQGADNSATAASTAVTFTDVIGSSVTGVALGSSQVGVSSGMTTVQPLTLTQRYLRVKAYGSASTALIPMTVAVVLIRRNAL